MKDKMIDLCCQVLHATESASADCLLSDHIEPDFHLVQPGRVGRCKMDMKTGMQGQPAFHAVVFMSGVVVDDQMDVKILWDIGIDVFEEVEIFLVAMSLFALGEDFTSSDVQSSEKGQGSVPHIVVGHTFDVSQTHGQNRLSPVQGLNLAFLIDTEDHGIFRGVQVEADDVSDFFNEKGVGGDFEMSLPMRLQAESFPDSLDSWSRNVSLFGHRADRPVGAALGFALECFSDEFGNLFIGNGAGTPGAEFIVQTGYSLFKITLPPQGYRLSAVVDLGSDVTIREALGRHQDNFCSGDQAVRQGSRASNGVKFHFFLLGQHNGFSWSSRSHGPPPSSQAHDKEKLLISQVIYETIH